jgi:Rad3-related DNA helicase
VLIVNHALLLADVAVENRALPEYDYLIIDEAHHLEDAATDRFSFRSAASQLKRLLQEIGRLIATKPTGYWLDVVGRPAPARRSKSPTRWTSLRARSPTESIEPECLPKVSSIN